MIDTKRLTTVKTITLGEGIRPMGTAMAKDGKHLYVSTGRSKMVFILDTSTNKVVGSIEAGQRPWGSRCRQTARRFTPPTGRPTIFPLSILKRSR